MDTRVIKKYPNRRLYDTVLSRYITLEDVRDLISDHVDIRVLEQRSGRDITRGVMLQVVTEQEQEQGEAEVPRLSEQFLAQLICTYRTAEAAETFRQLEECMGRFAQQSALKGH
jgi:polyhydroxyalkanoate synthesis repressor PhaR